MNERESIPLPEKPDPVNHLCTDNFGEQRVKPKESLKYLAILIPISVSIFCVLIWFMNEFVPVHYPDYAHFFKIYIYGSSSGGNLLFEVIGGFFLVGGFFTMKYDLYKRSMDEKYIVYRGKNRVFDRNPILSGIIYAAVLILLLPVTCWVIFSPYLHYLPYTFPIFHLDTYSGITILILLYSIIISIIMYLIPPSWEKLPRISVDEPKENKPQYSSNHNNNGKKRSHSHITSLSHWLTLSAGAFPVTLVIIILSILIITSNRLRDYQITISGVIQTIPGFGFPSSFLSGNGPSWGLLILGYAAYISLICSAIYLVSGYGTSDTIFNSGSRIMLFFWLQPYGLSFFTPYTLEIVNQDLVFQGIPKLEYFFSQVDYNFLIILIAFTLGYSIAYLDKRLWPEQTV
ncbi:MAG: hypothetical protein LUQ50_00470 [Methanospirillum sp.]|uniref:hypothetical protein n=1 Tax=Methanospirillum sp. TaxID=45200 RepID=UPI00236B5F44|nr:hypothetical protein [Methanospirillum sp.]MDD1727525.1 hypothetical protein [Methanospirillum sp.]